MILFSPSLQCFYSINIRYSTIPNDVIEISQDQHLKLLSKINEGHHILPDLTLTTQRPSAFHRYINGAWIDSRTNQEKRKAYHESLIPLSRRIFKLALLKHNLLHALEQKMSEIDDPNTRSRLEIEYAELTVFNRNDENVIQLLKLVNLNDNEIDQFWENAYE